MAKSLDYLWNEEKGHSYGMLLKYTVSILEKKWITSVARRKVGNSDDRGYRGPE